MNPNTQTQVTQTLTGMPPVVGVVMGSSSDWDVMQHAVHVLKQFGVPHEARVVSAHRMPDDMFAYAEEAAGRVEMSPTPSREMMPRSVESMRMRSAVSKPGAPTVMSDR